MKSLGKEETMLMALKSRKQQQKKKSINGDFLLSPEDEMVYEILSRLPVKTLMLCKCVCKRWLSIIKDNTYFINLHLSRSKLRPCFALAIPMKRKSCRPSGARGRRCDYIEITPHKAEILIADLSEKAGKKAAPVVDNVRKTVSLDYDGVLKPVNGLICFTDTSSDYGVCVYNLSTRELSPWIRTTFEEKNFSDYFLTYQFGFDPATKEHKVICIWKEYYDGYVNTEVMTVGTNTWRIIDEVPPHDLEETSVYANGSIYWITYDNFYRLSKRKEVLLVAFDVGSENYKTIAVPTFITDQFGEDYEDVTHLLEVNDRVALSHILPHGNIAKLWILDDETTNWREVTLELPFQWDKEQWVEFHGIAGTDQILLKTYKDTQAVSLYSYNWKSKAFTEVQTGELYDSTTVPAYYKMKASLSHTFTESLLSVHKK